MKEFIVENLRKMIDIDSESKGDMVEIIEFTTSLLDDIGLKCRVLKGDEFNLVIIASHGKGGICFSGHLDTVPLGDGWKHEQGEIEDGKIYGRGSLDMKGPCVAVIAAAKKLIEKDVPFSLIFTTDEEVSMNGALEAASEPEITEAPAVVVAEPTAKLVVTQEKGVYQFEIVTKGKNAHASMPEKGDNAIMKMVPIIKNLASKGKSPATKDEMTCSVNVIKAGSATNVIPKRCKAEVDVRFPPSFSRAELEDHLFGDITEEYELNVIQYLDAVKTDEDMDCVKKMLQIADTELWSVPYGTEMVRFNEYNKNTFIFGPGEVSSAHQPDEFIDLSHLYEIVDIYVEYAEAMMK
ncbi:MAG: M20 family metallopeptidase [Candidatus Saliniplasma sp.]